MCRVRVQVERLVTSVADKEQVHTQRYGLRPFGVGTRSFVLSPHFTSLERSLLMSVCFFCYSAGLLVIGYDKTGARLFENCPSGSYYDYKAVAIGARSQSARTYLEKHYAEFATCTKVRRLRDDLLCVCVCIT